MATIAQIRINKTPEISKILQFLKEEYYGLSESEIIKILLSQSYYQRKNKIILHEANIQDFNEDIQNSYNSTLNIPTSQLNNL